MVAQAGLGRVMACPTMGYRSSNIKGEGVSRSLSQHAENGVRVGDVLGAFMTPTWQTPQPEHEAGWRNLPC
jgi:hypothetical protein